MTGLYDKDYFEQKAAEQLQADPDEPYVMVCSDVRNFKLVNDVFGTRVGDTLLVKIAGRVREYARPKDVYGRIGGDKFAMVLPKSNFREEVFVNAQRGVDQLETDNHFPIDIYVGVYEIVERDIPISVMCDRAFMAINTIKHQYKRRVAYYDDTMRRNAMEEQQMSGELDDAIRDGQFAMYLQPQMNAEGKVLGAEALVRWIHPVKGLLMPGAFISLFERNGMIAKLDRHIWELACRQLRRWEDEGRKDLYISVNISPKDFYYMDVYQTLVGLAEQYQFSPKNLKLEITETAVAMNIDMLVELIGRLRDYGFVVEMDDFGSGYSSLNMLKDIKVDVLKVDMAFLGKTDDDERAGKILRTVVDLSRQLSMPVIVEGVETVEQVDFLFSIGCDMFQGYYFAKPMKLERFEELYM